MTNKNIEQVYQMISKDSALQARLRAASDRKSQVALVVQVGKEKGYDFKTSEVETFLADREGAKEGALSDEALDTVVGGNFSPTQSGSGSSDAGGGTSEDDEGQSDDP